MSFSFATFGNDLYTGKRSIPVVPQRRRFYLVSLVMIVIAVLGLVDPGPQPGPGVPRRVRVPRRDRRDARRLRADRATAVGASEDERGVNVTLVGNNTVRVQTERLSDTDSQKVAHRPGQGVRGGRVRGQRHVHRPLVGCLGEPAGAARAGHLPARGRRC